MKDIEGTDKCDFYFNFMDKADQLPKPVGNNTLKGMKEPIYTLDDLKDLGKEWDMCPYFLARKFLLQANIIVYNYSYMLDPKIANLVSSEL